MSVVILEYPAMEMLRGSRFIWRVTREGQYVWYRPEKPDFTLRVSALFCSDLTSVPRGLWNIFPPLDGQYFEAALLHDYCYAFHNLPKPDADLIFYECMETTGTPAWKRELLYKAVKWFGQSSYDSGPARRVARQETVRALLAQ